MAIIDRQNAISVRKFVFCRVPHRMNINPRTNSKLVHTLANIVPNDNHITNLEIALFLTTKMKYPKLDFYLHRHKKKQETNYC